MNLAEVWDHLEQDHGTGTCRGRMQRRIRPTNRRDFFLGLELPSRNRMLILRTSFAPVNVQLTVPSSRGLTVRIRESDIDSSIAEVELVLTDDRQYDIFDILIEDLVDIAEQEVGEEAGVRKFLSRLSDWQQLLMRIPAGVLSRENQQGLWGELWTIREVVGSAIGFLPAIRAWRGSFGADQDLQLSGAALEVKTRTGHSLERVMIASERQLDVPPGITLGLIALLLDARPGHGETLVEIVQTVRTSAAEAGCLEILDERLALSGYRSEDTDSYSDIGYTVTSRRQFRVHHQFPRIVSADLRPGVSRVSYSVTIAACVEFEITGDQLAELLKGE